MLHFCFNWLECHGFFVKIDITKGSKGIEKSGILVMSVLLKGMVIKIMSVWRNAMLLSRQPHCAKVMMNRFVSTFLSQYVGQTSVDWDCYPRNDFPGLKFLCLVVFQLRDSHREFPRPSSCSVCSSQPPGQFPTRVVSSSWGMSPTTCLGNGLSQWTLSWSKPSRRNNWISDFIRSWFSFAVVTDHGRSFEINFVLISVPKLSMCSKAEHFIVYFLI